MNARRFRQMKAAARPAYFIVILVLSSIVVSQLCRMIKQTKLGVILESFEARNKIFSEIEKEAQQLYKLNITAANLARALSSSLNGTALTFAEIDKKVAPTLFLALSIIPQLSQISYIGLDGLLFSYYNDGDQTLVVYSNTSFSSNWYTNPVNRDNGMLYGDAVVSQSAITVNASWIQKALNSTSGCSSMGTKWNMEQESLVLNTAAMDGRGVISVGFSTEEVVDHFAALDFHGGYFHLSTMDNQVIVQTKHPNMQIDIYNGTVLVQLLRPDGVLIGYDSFSCDSDDGNLRPLNAMTPGLKYTFYCSTIDIVGVPSVYVLAYPRNTLVELVNKNSRSSLVLLGLVFVFIIISVGLYLILTARATKREMFLCASLIKQTEATQQAERKSMNKTKAYAAANHDVRACLAAITGLIHLCQDDANPASKLAENLVLMNKCASDLLDILNSILDMSKIEAGKTSLVIEKFNLAQLLEDVVNRFYPVGMKKEKCVDIVLDPCDGSILKSPLVRGDQLKLKQILCNLLNNAIKFTDGGHVSVRAVVKRNNFEKEIIASNRSSMSKFLSQFCYKKNENGFNDLDALHTAEEIPNEVEFEFEVDDTGKGIPKDKQKTIFEDYVQVKETDIEHQGCGLGLGIVQSLVRVMKGELRIVDKEPGERGTCFRFNVFLSVCEPESADTEETRSSVLNQHFAFTPSRPEGSHVILFLSGQERQKVVKKFIESLNIKVSVIKQRSNFRNELEKIKRKLDPNCFSTGKSEPSPFDYSSKSVSTDLEAGASDGSRCIRDAPDQITPNYRKNNSRSSLAFVLLVIDPAAASNYSDFLTALVNFRKDHISKAFCKVVWLENPMMPDQRDKNRQTAGCDYVISKPLHGSQLIQMLSLLPERKAMFPCNVPKSTVGPTSLDIQQFSTEFNLSGIELETSSSHSISQQPTTSQKHHQEGAEKPLKGKKVLLVDDDNVIRFVTIPMLKKYGANVEACTNGQEAFHKVCKALTDWRKEGSSKSLPYDYIFMDCQMPVMDGYEATRLIRMEEEHYDVHHPIIALTANAMTEEASKSIDVGMDFHLTKPLQVEKMLNVIRSVETANKKF